VVVYRCPEKRDYSRRKISAKRRGRGQEFVGPLQPLWNIKWITRIQRAPALDHKAYRKIKGKKKIAPG